LMPTLRTTQKCVVLFCFWGFGKQGLRHG